MDARKVALQPNDVIKLFGEINEIHVCRGQKIHRLELNKEKLGAASTAMLLGPSGKLRAPTLKHGKILIVGFNEACYGSLL